MGKGRHAGTLNFLNEKKRKEAVSLVEGVVTVSCARTISFQESLDSTAPVVRCMVESGEDGHVPCEPGGDRLHRYGISSLHRHSY